MRAALLILLLAGCLAAPPPEAAQDPGPSPVALVDPFAKGAGQAELQAVADARAAAWNPAARLFIVSTFSGETWGPATDAWIAPYEGTAGSVAHGRNVAWTFHYAISHAADDETDTASQTVRENTPIEPPRVAFIITLDQDGQALAEYTSHNRNEGALNVPFLPDGTLDSVEAGAVATAAGLGGGATGWMTLTTVPTEDEPVWWIRDTVAGHAADMYVGAISAQILLDLREQDAS